MSSIFVVDKDKSIRRKASLNQKENGVEKTLSEKRET